MRKWRILFTLRGIPIGRFKARMAAGILLGCCELVSTVFFLTPLELHRGCVFDAAEENGIADAPGQQN